MAYSPFHDPLVLSSSTDTTVCVWFMPALAKAKGAEVKATGGKVAGSTRYVGHRSIVDTHVLFACDCPHCAIKLMVQKVASCHASTC